MNETGDGVNLESNFFDVCNLDNAMSYAGTSRPRHIILEENGIEQVGDEEKNYVLLQVCNIFNPDLLKL